MWPLEETIVGVASAFGGSPRGVLRMSGPQTLSCLAACFSRTADLSWPPQQPTVLASTLRLPTPFAPLPGELYVWPETRSYTRQPSAEFHTLGSPPLLAAAVDTVCRHGARLARPGEFTLRAFLAGRLDLTQVEAVLGVIDAEDRATLDAALVQLAGGLSRPLDQLRSDLLDLLADLEAGLDFVDEDIQFVTPSELRERLGRQQAVLGQLLRRLETRGEVADEARVVLYGWPNVGKSSLFNALVQDEAAIVSAQPGTTRDYLTRHLSWLGCNIKLIDTAGKESDATGLRAAQELATEQTRFATCKLLCLDAQRPLNDWERAQLRDTQHESMLVVLTKADQALPHPLPCSGIVTSSHTGQGLETLRRAVVERLTGQTETSLARQAVGIPATAIRCRESLRRAGEALRQAELEAERGMAEELVAGELRLALEELGSVVGAVYTEDLLDRIFSRFCIGK